MDTELIIYGLIGLAVLYVVIKLLKWPIKLLINGVVGVVLLYLTNILGVYIGLPQIGINPITALVAGILGVPGVIFLILFTLFF